ncbi:hypothetical protein HY636_05460 [Candidatus Woesearchaeota archaeon]|nr:hypothetical protein [Candidatus Woesearchaeota archaeon]
MDNDYYAINCVKNIENRNIENSNIEKQSSITFKKNSVVLTMELSEVVETFEHNLKQLEQAQVGNYLSFDEFRNKASSLTARNWDLMEIVNSEMCIFQTTLEKKYGNSKYKEYVEFSKRLASGISKSVISFNVWYYEKPTVLQSLLFKVSKTAEKKYRERKKQLIKDILSFQCYALAHLALRDQVPVFCEMYASPVMRMGWNEYTCARNSGITEFNPTALDNILPMPEDRDIISICFNFLRVLADETGTKFEQRNYMKREGFGYTL